MAPTADKYANDGLKSMRKRLGLSVPKRDSFSLWEKDGQVEAEISIRHPNQSANS